jgi:Fe-S cluster assembly protein SufD
LHLVHLSTARRRVSPSRTRLTVGAGVTCSLSETFVSIDGARLTSAATSIDVGAGARVEHVRIVHVGRERAHVGSTEIVGGEAAQIRTAALQLGAGPIRHSVAAELVGHDAAFELGGLSIPAAGGHHDLEVSVRHAASNGTSRQLAAGVVPDGARVSFGGHVVVAAGTEGTDADQQSRNLLMGPTARADARPWLEISSDDVRCTHGAALGGLDDDGLYYLRTRGIPAHEARDTLVRAFVATVLDTVVAPGARNDWLAAAAGDAIDDALRTPTSDLERNGAPR